MRNYQCQVAGSSGEGGYHILSSRPVNVRVCIRIVINCRIHGAQREKYQPLGCVGLRLVSRLRRSTFCVRRSRRFRTRLTYAAPPALVRHEIVRLPKLTTENRERSLVGAKLHCASVGMTT